MATLYSKNNIQIYVIKIPIPLYIQFHTHGEFAIMKFKSWAALVEKTHEIKKKHPHFYDHDMSPFEGMYKLELCTASNAGDISIHGDGQYDYGQPVMWMRHNTRRWGHPCERKLT